MLAQDLELIPATIALGAALSGQVNLGAKTLVGLFMPPAWTAAALTFQASADGGATFGEMRDGAGAISFTVSAGVFIGVDPAEWRGINCIKARSGTAAAPVNQAAQAKINLLVKSKF
jgi:hypothetical protein